MGWKVDMRNWKETEKKEKKMKEEVWGRRGRGLWCFKMGF